MDILKFIFDIVVWFVAPGLLAYVAIRSAALYLKVSGRKHRSAMKAGFWAGTTLFLAVFVYQVSNVIARGSIPEAVYQGFSFLLSGTALLSVFLTLHLARKFLTPELAGVVVFLLSFVSLSGITHYLLIRSGNDLALSLILGGAVGAFAYFMIRPSTIHDFLKD